jgi:hypothetical protein
MGSTIGEDKATAIHDESAAPLEEAKERIRELNERAKSYIKEHPAACLVGALALGYVVARFARWRS